MDKGSGSGGGREGFECPPEDIVFDPRTGARICKSTGVVLEDQALAEEAEWRAYTPEERQARARVGAPLSLSEPNFGVTADMVRRPGSRLPSRAPLIARGRRGLYGYPTASSVDRNVNQALNVIRDIAKRLSLPDDVVEEAARLYREAAARGLTRGRSIDIMAAAAVYAACRLVQVPCTLEEVARTLTGREGDLKREVGRCFRLLVRDLSLKIPAVRPEAYVSRIVSALGLPDYIAVEAAKIVRIAKEKGLTAGKDPSGLAAAAVYLAAQKRGIRKTQKEVANVAGVTEVTVRNRYKEISKVLSELYLDKDAEGG